MYKPKTNLSHRELQVAGLLIKGCKNAEIAKIIKINTKEVSHYKKKIRTKLNIDHNKNDFIMVHQILFHFQSLDNMSKILLSAEYDIQTHLGKIIFD